MNLLKREDGLKENKGIFVVRRLELAQEQRQLLSNAVFSATPSKVVPFPAQTNRFKRRIHIQYPVSTKIKITKITQSHIGRDETEGRRERPNSPDLNISLRATEPQTLYAFQSSRKVVGRDFIRDTRESDLSLE